MKKIIMMMAIFAGTTAISAKATFAADAVFVDAYEKAVAREDANVLVVFGTDWCTYCHKLEKDLKSLGLEDYTICVVDADKNKELRKQYGVKSYPTSVIVRNKKEVSRKSGYVRDEYENWLESNRKKSGPESPSRKCGPGCKCSPDQGPGCKCNPDCKCGRDRTWWGWISGEEE